MKGSPTTSWWQIGCIALCLACLAQGAMLLHERDRLAYFQSKVEEYRLLADLRSAFPKGSLETAVLDVLGTEARAVVEPRADGRRLSVRWPLPVQPTRDYRGYMFHFKEGRLVDLDEVGPDPAGLDLKPTDELERRLGRSLSVSAP